MTNLPNPFEDIPLAPVAPKTRREPMLWLNSSHGIYIPQAFARSFKDRDSCVAGVTDQDWSILDLGPENEEYWEVWDDILFRGDVLVTDVDGTQFFPYQDYGDLWLIPVGMEWDEDRDFYVWPEDEA